MAIVEAIKAIKPHVLIGATGSPGTFTQAVIEQMSQINERPVIFALSNPTSRAECTAEQAYKWSCGKAIFTSGSPFGVVEYAEKTYHPGQGNNAYVFPGIGLGAVACEAREINDDMFLASAQALAELVTENDLSRGTLYPPLSDIRAVSLDIAVAVAEKAYEYDLAGLDKPTNLKSYIASLMYDPRY